MPIWDRFITKEDKEIYKLSGHGGKVGLGKRPALLIIDVTYDFVGDKPEPIKESIKSIAKVVVKQVGGVFFRLRNF